MTGWVIQFDGTIFEGTPFNRMSKIFDFSGEGITTSDPSYEQIDPDGKIFKEVAEFFKIKAPFTITLRVWHPSNTPEYQFKKAWANP